MKWRGAFVAAVVFALLSMMTASAANVVANSSFETADAWVFSGGAARLTGIAHAGTYGAKTYGQDSTSNFKQSINWGGGTATANFWFYRGPACGDAGSWYYASFGGVTQSYSPAWSQWVNVGVSFGTIPAGTYDLTFWGVNAGVSVAGCWDEITMDGPATPTPAPTNTPTRTPTLTPTIAPSPTPTNTSTPFPTLTSTLVPTALPTITPTSTSTPIPSSTPLPTSTNTPALTRTPTPSRTPGVATGIIDDRQLPGITASTIDKQVARWIGQNWLMLLGVVMIGFDILDQFLAASQKTLDATVVRYTKQMAAKDGGVLFVERRLKGADAERMIKDQGVADDDDDDENEDSGEGPTYEAPPWQPKYRSGLTNKDGKWTRDSDAMGRKGPSPTRPDWDS